MPYDSTDFVATVRMLDRDPKTLATPRERLEYLRDFLRERVRPENFHMADWVNGDIGEGDADSRARISGMECGTTACIGGWTNTLWPVGGLWDSDVAMATLGLDREQGCNLFFEIDDAKGAAAPAQAANVLDHLIRTGEVDWSVA